MNTPDILSRGLPDPESAERFLRQLADQHPDQSKKLLQKDGLLSDVLTLVSYSPMIASALLYYPEYLWWLERKRKESGVRTKDELLESLARFALTHSQTENNILLARFRRREMIRIFLADIRRLLTIAEITEGISNLADAILENAVRVATQELDNLYGSPQETDPKGRQRSAQFCVVSLGKLGSRELNYSSDIDLLFIFSANGKTSAHGSRKAISNLEFFSKLSGAVTKMVGGQSGEGAAYRVDLRLRPHGRVGPLAMSLDETVRYYVTGAAGWERQVLIRSRTSGGDAGLFHRFFEAVEGSVFSTAETVENALANVRQSKQKIDFTHRNKSGVDVKLGRGGIREIEFIAQALQLAYGGRDTWLRAPHTLISLSRIADRGLISDAELTQLFDAYEFLRRLEHLLQMENGLQTHRVPDDRDKRRVLAKRMMFETPERFETAIRTHCENVHRVFERVFDTAGNVVPNDADAPLSHRTNFYRVVLDRTGSSLADEITASIARSDTAADLGANRRILLAAACEVSHRVVEMIVAYPHLINAVPETADAVRSRSYSDELLSAVREQNSFGGGIAALRRCWSQMYFELLLLDAVGEFSLNEVKLRQTILAEASIAAAIDIVKHELSRRYDTNIAHLGFAVLGMGKLGSGGLDYDSDLDLVMIYDADCGLVPKGVAESEFYARAVETFVTALSGVTRDGSLYRIDLRLRPHGKDGPSSIAAGAFVEYVEQSAAIWELLAFLKLRAAGGDVTLGRGAESAVRTAIHNRAASIDRVELSEETRRVRQRLENERANVGDRSAADIKFGAGGMLDIYFAVRYLQLRDHVPDLDGRRATGDVLSVLLANASLDKPEYAALAAGYAFLSDLDHNLRLTVGRTSKLPRANHKALAVIADRMNLSSPAEIEQNLAIHRIEIRSAFDRILTTDG